MPAKATLLALDIGTTGVTALVVNESGMPQARGYREFPQHFPHPGWVEHDLDEMWDATLAAARDALDGEVAVDAIGITNQRETLCLWERGTGRPARRAIVWQDRRTSSMCEQLSAAGHSSMVHDLTGLVLDPYFTGSKVAWLRDEEPELHARLVSGELVMGTVDSYIVARLSGGAAHVSDASNASRTLLADITTGTWAPSLMDLFGAPADALPRIVPCWGEMAQSSPGDFLGVSAPITGMAGDQQAALIGQGCTHPGDVKCTYGTGSFVVANAGTTRPTSTTERPELLSTIAWQEPSGQVVYAQEGAIFVTGAAVQWLRDGLGLIERAEDIEELARGAEGTSDGVCFVPALTGLGSPHWAPDARGMITGITRGTTKHHLAHATLEAICCQVRDVMVSLGEFGATLRVDGGAASNDLLMQMQANHLGVAITRPAVTESTGLGAAFLAGLGIGVWDSPDALRNLVTTEKSFRPEPDGVQAANTYYSHWKHAVALATR